MRAYKRWDASGTVSHITIVGEMPAGARTDLIYREIPDGVSTIMDPIALLIHHADGSEERVAVEDVRAVECGHPVDISERGEQ